MRWGRVAVLVVGALLFAPAAPASATGPPAACGTAGIDVSSYQGTIDFAQVKAAGNAFVYARVADGTTLDTHYAGYYAGAKASGLAVGAYQHFEPAQDPVAQANAFLSNAGLVAGDLRPILDVEISGTLTPSQMLSAITTWLNTVGGALGVKPAVYTLPSFWNTHVAAGLAAAGYQLWVANFGVSSPTLPSEWSTWALWQWTDSGTVTGVSGVVDVDCLNGTDLSTLVFTPAPVSSAAPQIVGSPSVGATLTCSPGTWSGTPSFAYQWQRDGSPIATGSSYTTGPADAGHQLTCAVTATNAGGSGSATSAALAIPAPPPASSAPASPAPSGQSSAAQLALACSNHRVVLLDVLPRGGRVFLLGVADPALAGRQALIFFAAGRRAVAHATVGADGSFSTTAPLPPASLAAGNGARYTAVVGTLRSAALKLTRRLVVNPATVTASTVTLSGDVTPPLAAPRAAVVVERQLSCHGTPTVVARVTPGAGGRFSVTVPAGGNAAIYTLATKVRVSARSPRLFATNSLPLYAA